MIDLTNLDSIPESLDTMPYEELKIKAKELSLLIKYLSGIIENAPDGIYITDGDANAILINKAFERISGLDRKKLIHRNHRDLEREKIIAKSCALEVLRKKQTVTIIHEYLTTGRQALDTCTPIFDEEGNIVLTISSIRDLTELNDLRERFKEETILRSKYEKMIEVIQEQTVHDEELIIHDEKMMKVLVMANKVSHVDSSVMLFGETGSGKEEIARYIHKNSGRKDEAFIGVNCGALPENLIESELFGYVSGAFTGAQKDGKAGLIEAADKGTLFLDEIGELPLNVQVKLLRVLQNRAVTRVGGTREIPVNIRIISATHRDLPRMVKEGSFREDLYYRLNVVPVEIPPLRDRVNDIIPMIQHFLKSYNEQYQMHKMFSKTAYDTMVSYSWPGNVRELRNLVERVVVTNETDLITAEDLPIHQHVMTEIGGISGRKTLKDRVEYLEYTAIMEAYEKYPNVRKAAEYLGMTEPTYVRKRKNYMKKYRFNNES